MTSPIWKPIGEASDSFDSMGLYIEKIDGIRVPVMRAAANRYTGEQALLDQENINRVQRDILREAYRNSMERADTRTAAELRDSMERAEDELRRNEAKVRQEASRLYPMEPGSLNPFNNTYNWHPWRVPVLEVS